MDIEWLAGLAHRGHPGDSTTWYADSIGVDLIADPRTQGPSPGTRALAFLDGSSHVVPADTCRGCFMTDHPELMPAVIDPVLDLGDIVVRQDAEWPVPGFYVVSVREHIGSLADLDDELAGRLGVTLALVRRGMRQALSITRAQAYTEERLSMPHLHTWLLPLWPQVMARTGVRPKVYEGNVKTYIDVFAALFTLGDTAAAIEDCNRRMRAWLATQPARQTLGAA